jgi:hypothetical protein
MPVGAGHALIPDQREVEDREWRVREINAGGVAPAPTLAAARVRSGESE